MFILSNKYEESSPEEEDAEGPQMDIEQNREFQAMKSYMDKEKAKSQYQRYQELLEKDKTSLTSKFRLPKQGQTKKSNGVAWGMVADDDIYEGGDHNTIIDTKILRLLPNLTDKQIQKIEMFEKKLRKMEFMQREYNRVLSLYERQLKGQSTKNIDFESVKGKNVTDPQATLELKNNLDKKLEKFASELDVSENKLKTMFGFPVEDEKTKYRRAGITQRSVARKEVDSDEEDEFFDRTLAKENQDEDKKVKMQRLIKLSANYSFSDLRLKLDDLGFKKRKMTRQLLDLNMGKLKQGQDDELDAVMNEANTELIREKKVALIQNLKSLLIEIEE